MKKILSHPTQLMMVMIDDELLTIWYKKRKAILPCDSFLHYHRQIHSEGYPWWGHFRAESNRKNFWRTVPAFRVGWACRRVSFIAVFPFGPPSTVRGICKVCTCVTTVIDIGATRTWSHRFIIFFYPSFHNSVLFSNSLSSSNRRSWVIHTMWASVGRSTL